MTNDDTCRAGVPAPVMELTDEDRAFLAAAQRPSLEELHGTYTTAWLAARGYGPNA